MRAVDSPLAALRSLLFVPGDDEAKLLRAPQRGADALILDLEDAVEPARKAFARELVARVLGGPPQGAPRLVRVNAAGGPELAADLEALRDAGADGLVLPKATAAALEAIGAGGPPVVALIESAAGLRDVRAIAAHPAVGALMLGSVDLSADLGLTPRADGLELLYARSALVVESAAAGIRPPFDGVHLDVRDLEGLAAHARLARSLGMGGKACIHPAQIAVVHDA